MKIESWLSNLGLNEYISIFKENEITFDDLLTLTSEDLKTELGITKLIDRKKILQAISELNLNENKSEKLSNYLEVEKIPFCLYEPFHEFKKEKHPRVKLFWLIDTSEYAIKFIVSILLSEILRVNDGELPETLKEKIRDHIERPTLGKWLDILAELSRGKPKAGTLFNELFDLNSNVINDRFKTENLGGNIENSILVLRNQLAHGGGMSSEKAKLLVEVFERQICEIINGISKALENSIIIAKNGFKSFDIFCNEMLEVPIPDIIKYCSDGVWLIKNDEILNLSPITVFEPIQQGSNGGEMIKKDKPSLQVYARSNRDKLVYSPIGSDEALSENFELHEFKKMFGLDTERIKIKSEHKSEDLLWDDFIREARLASEDLVGRNDEVKSIKAWLKSRDSFNSDIPKSSWIYGGPGLGKSLLISRIVSDYCNSSSKYKGLFYYRFRGGDARNNRLSFLKYFKNALLAWEPLTQFIEANYLNEYSDISDLVISIKHILNQISKIENDNPKAPKPSFWIFVDGVDEIISSDRSIVAMFYELVLQGTVWTFSGRPENNLNDTFKGHNADFIFQNGLPLLSENDIREMLLDGLGKIKYDLLKLDLDDNNGIENKFIQKVIEKAQGLPIYVSLLIRDLCSGQYKINVDTILPNGLSEYYNIVLDRIGLSSVKRDLPLIISILSIVDEPLDSEALTILLANNVSEDFDFYKKRVDEAIRVGSSLLRIAPTSYSTNGWTLYHQSFRDHVNGTLNKNHNPLHDVVIESRRLISRIIESWGNLKQSTLKNHLFQYGNSYDIKWRDNGKFSALARLTNLNYILIRLKELNNNEVYKIVHELENIWDLLITECSDGVSGFGFPQLDSSNIETFTKFFRETAHIISQDDSEWTADKIALQLAVEYGKVSAISVNAINYLNQNNLQLEIFKANIPDKPKPSTIIRTIKIHETKIKGVLYIENERAISWDDDNYISIWSLHNGEIINHFKYPGRTKINSIFNISISNFLVHANESLSLWEYTKKEPSYFYESKNLNNVIFIQDNLNNSKAYVVQNNDRLLLFDINDGNVISSLNFESRILGYINYNSSIILLTEDSNLFEINEYESTLKITKQFKSENTKGILNYADDKFLIWSETYFELIEFESFTSIVKSSLRGDIININRNGFIVSKHYKYYPSKDYYEIDIIDAESMQNIYIKDTLIPYGLHYEMAANHANVDLYNNNIVSTFFYGQHINVYNLFDHSQNHVEFNRDVYETKCINKNLIAVIGNGEYTKRHITLVNLNEYNILIDLFCEDIFRLNDDYFIKTTSNGKIELHSTAIYETLKNSKEFNLFSEIKAIKYLDDKRFITISWKTTYEWGGHYIISLYCYDENYSINLIQSDESLTKLLHEKDIENVFEKFTKGLEANNDEKNYTNILNGIKRLIEEKITEGDSKQGRDVIDIKIKTKKLSFKDNIFLMKRENDDRYFKWYSNSNINSIWKLSEKHILIQSGYSNLEILEIKHPAPNSVQAP